MKIPSLSIVSSILLLAGCASDPVVGFPAFNKDHVIVLTAGQSVILARGQRALVPFGSSVIQPGPKHNEVTLNGQKNTVYTEAGAIVTVPVDAAGTSDNIVIAK